MMKIIVEYNHLTENELQINLYSLNAWEYSGSAVYVLLETIRNS